MGALKAAFDKERAELLAEIERLKALLAAQRAEARRPPPSPLSSLLLAWLLLDEPSIPDSALPVGWLRPSKAACGRRKQHAAVESMRIASAPLGGGRPLLGASARPLQPRCPLGRAGPRSAFTRRAQLMSRHPRGAQFEALLAAERARAEKALQDALAGANGDLDALRAQFEREKAALLAKAQADLDALRADLMARIQALEAEVAMLRAELAREKTATVKYNQVKLDLEGALDMPIGRTVGRIMEIIADLKTFQARPQPRPRPRHRPRPCLTVPACLPAWLPACLACLLAACLASCLLAWPACVAACLAGRRAGWPPRKLRQRVCKAYLMACAWFGCRRRRRRRRRGRGLPSTAKRAQLS